MKSKKFKLSLVMVFSLLFLASILNTESVQGQDYSYPSDIAVGNSYEWEVTELTILGTVNTDNVTNGTPSELVNPANIWVAFYLNGEFKTNETDQIGLLDLGWLSMIPIGQDDFFLQPTTYENATDVYNYFEILNANFPQYVMTMEDEIESHGYYNHYTMKLKMSSKLTSKSWTIKFQFEESNKENDLLDPMDWEKIIQTTSRYIEIRFNVKTGFVTYLDYQYIWHQERTVEGSVDIDDDNITLLIKSTDLPTGAPFDWGYSIIGLAVISILVYYRKRR